MEDVSNMKARKHETCLGLKHHTLRKNSVVSNRNLLFQGSIFRGYVSFREGHVGKHENTLWHLNILKLHLDSDLL